MLQAQLDLLGWTDKSALDDFKNLLGFQGSTDKLVEKLVASGSILATETAPTLTIQDCASLAIVDKFAASVVRTPGSSAISGNSRERESREDDELLKMQAFVTQHLESLQSLTLSRDLLKN